MAKKITRGLLVGIIMRNRSDVESFCGYVVRKVLIYPKGGIKGKVDKLEEILSELFKRRKGEIKMYSEYLQGVHNKVDIELSYRHARNISAIDTLVDVIYHILEIYSETSKEGNKEKLEKIKGKIKKLEETPSYIG